MSFLRRGERRRKAGAVLTTVGALAAFQVLAIVGATGALASTCLYNPATDTINITIDANESVALAVESAAADLDNESPPGAILANLDGLGFENGAASTACGSADNSNTVAIVVLGQPSSNEAFAIQNNVGGAGTSGEFSTAIAWNIDLGTGTGDVLALHLGDGDDTLTATNTSFDLNGGTGEVLGAETFFVAGEDGDDTIDLSATSIQNIVGAGADDDFVAPGTGGVPPSPADSVAGQGGDDTLSYATRTTSVGVLNGVLAGAENGDLDWTDAGDELDFIDCFEVIETGSGNDTIEETGCGATTIRPGDGDDFVQGTGNDTIDWSTSSAGMVIDIPNESATGQGTDTWDDVDMFIGSDFDDTMLVDDDAPGPGVTDFSGIGGVDTVDASGATGDVDINLDILDPEGDDDLENIVGGPGNDELDGNDIQNLIQGGDGNDFLDGQPGNDELQGGPGNDTFRGDTGADTVSFRNSPNGVEVDMLAGFATGEGDDSFSPFPGPGPDIEIVVGSDFNDSMTGGGGSVATNFRFVGRGGSDVLTGSGSNDTLKGGGGADTLRGVTGDDTLVGNKGRDLLAGGGGFDIGKGGKGNDTCRGIEDRHSC